MDHTSSMDQTSVEQTSPTDVGVRLVLFGAALGPLVLTMVLLFLT